MKLSVWVLLGILAWLQAIQAQSTAFEQMNTIQIIQDAVKEAFMLSRAEVQNKYKVYLAGASLSKSSQMLIGDSIVFDFVYRNKQILTSYDCQVKFDLIYWQPKIVYFVWTTSIDDLIEFAKSAH